MSAEEKKEICHLFPLLLSLLKVEDTEITHNVNDHLSQRLSLFFCQVLEDVTVLLLQKLEPNCEMVVFQHR